MFQIEAKASHKRAISQKLQTTNYINLSGSLKDYGWLNTNKVVVRG
jgi:hypothetical protein